MEFNFHSSSYPLATSLAFLVTFLATFLATFPLVACPLVTFLPACPLVAFLDDLALGPFLGLVTDPVTCLAIAFAITVVESLRIAFSI